MTFKASIDDVRQEENYPTQQRLYGYSGGYCILLQSRIKFEGEPSRHDMCTSAAPDRWAESSLVVDGPLVCSTLTLMTPPTFIFRLGRLIKV